jgi:PGF-CTERM protein
MNKKTFKIGITVLLTVSLLSVAFASVTVVAITSDKEYIETFNEYYVIIKEDVREAEVAYHAGFPEVYKNRLDDLIEDVGDATNALSVYNRGTSEQIRSRVIPEVGEASMSFWRAQMQAKYEGLGAYSYDPESSFENLKEGMEHLDKAKSSLPESKVPGFSAILAIAGILVVACLVRRKR